MLYLGFPRFFEGIRQIQTHKSYLPYYNSQEKKKLNGSLVRKCHCIKSEANQRHDHYCAYSDKKFHYA